MTSRPRRCTQRVAVLAVAAASCSMASPLGAGAQYTDVSAAAWLAGCWVAASSTGGTTEEAWMRPAGGTMVGMARSVREGIATGYEFLVLHSVDGRLVYSAHPSRQAPTDFRVTELSRNKLRVENADHDFPQRIEYVPIGADSVVASVYAAVDDTRPAFSLHYRRSVCEPEPMAPQPVTSLSEQEDLWRPFRDLVGTWEGTGVGVGTVSDVSHRWEFVIDEHFLRLRTRSASAAADGSEEVHEDVGYVSHDADHERFVFRQFLSEGYVNTYDVIVRGDDAPTIEFAYRAAESAGGVRAQMRLVFTSPNEYEMVLDLAPAGEPFVACQTMTMKRVP